jgi:hypothetical protein
VPARLCPPSPPWPPPQVSAPPALCTACAAQATGSRCWGRRCPPPPPTSCEALACRRLPPASPPTLTLGVLGMSGVSLCTPSPAAHHPARARAAPRSRPCSCVPVRQRAPVAHATPAPSPACSNYIIIHALCTNLFRFIWCVLPGSRAADARPPQPTAARSAVGWHRASCPHCCAVPPHPPPDPTGRTRAPCCL